MNKAAENNNVSELYIAKIRTHFYRRDFDQSGFISIDDVANEKAKKAQSHNIDLKTQELLDGYRKAWNDLGMPPTVNFQQCLQGYCNMVVNYKENPDSVLELCKPFSTILFDAIDSNKDGFVSKNEFKNWFELLTLAKDAEGWEKTFSLLDKDQNGVLSREELNYGLCQYFAVDDESDYQHLFGCHVTKKEWEARYGAQM